MEPVAQDGHPERRDRGRPRALEEPRGEQHAVRRGERSHQRAAGHQRETDQQRQPDADQVGDSAVDSGGHRQHQHVEADRPRGDPDAHAEVLRHRGQHDRCGRGAHPRQAEQRSEQEWHAARVGGHDWAQPHAHHHHSRWSSDVQKLDELTRTVGSSYLVVERRVGDWASLERLRMCKIHSAAPHAVDRASSHHPPLPIQRSVFNRASCKHSAPVRTDLGFDGARPRRPRAP